MLSLIFGTVTKHSERFFYTRFLLQLERIVLSRNKTFVNSKKMSVSLCWWFLIFSTFKIQIGSPSSKEDVNKLDLIEWAIELQVHIFNLSFLIEDLIFDFRIKAEQNETVLYYIKNLGPGWVTFIKLTPWDWYGRLEYQKYANWMKQKLRENLAALS